MRAGPAHATYGHTVGSEPCTGHVLKNDASSGYRNWKFNGCCDSKEWAKWDYDSDGKKNGVYYFYQGSPKVPKNPGSSNNPWKVTINGIFKPLHTGRNRVASGPKWAWTSDGLNSRRRRRNA